MNEVTPRIALTRLRVARSAGTLAALCDRHGLRLLVVFGSASREADAERAADLDLAFLPGPPVDQLALLQGLYELTGYESVDLMDLSRAGIVARAHALGRGQLLFEDEAHRFAEQQLLAIARRADTQWLRNLELGVLAGP